MVYLIINAGSSSLKFSLFDADSLQEILHGSVTGIGFDQTTFQVAGEQSEDTESSEVRADDHEAAAGILKGWLAQKFPEGGIEAIGHRWWREGICCSKTPARCSGCFPKQNREFSYGSLRRIKYPFEAQ